MLDFSLNKTFSFDELSKDVQNDFLLQLGNNFEFYLQEFSFKLRLVSYEELSEELDAFFGNNLIDEVEDNYILELANDIVLNGLKNPPIGSEGKHRTLAHHYLHKDMLRYDIIMNKYIYSD